MQLNINQAVINAISKLNMQNQQDKYAESARLMETLHEVA